MPSEYWLFCIHKIRSESFNWLQPLLKVLIKFVSQLISNFFYLNCMPASWINHGNLLEINGIILIIKYTFSIVISASALSLWYFILMHLFICVEQNNLNYRVAALLEAEKWVHFSTRFFHSRLNSTDFCLRVTVSLNMY